ncbi:monovalent cation/H+ antiporter subunit D family protein [Arachnia propionica]|uniref:Monovalent cation/H+ antiporter subunit D family protein n=1 Tax=Arachnia propionica TaxID=1750 RepID=A0A3P1TCZ4_9ACTN|nr:monovalent cation/H+ antiporter subunit D family protein [Arachnia propionica]MDO5081999.1 monovalent cation/H+ antiporter subunit D family protein [Arachnia propionica]RRD07158.1 monovalent cation/H+ antiporter subunit D family protein [Arachnia propionica]
MSAVLPLFAAIPLLLAGATVLLRHALTQRLLLLVCSLGILAGGLALLLAHRGTPVVSHSVGSYLPGVGIVFVSDTLSAVMLVATSFMSLVSSVFLMLTGEDRYRFVVPLILMLSAGVNGAILTGDLFNLFVWVEVMLLPSYALVAVTGYWRRLGIGRMFIIVNIITSTILLLGVGLLYGAAGTVNLAALANRGGDPQISLATGVIMFALLVKAGVVPVHGWLPRAYPATSAGIMSLFAGVHTKVSLYAVYRIYLTIFDGPAPWLPVLAVLVVATIVIGSLSTFGEKRIRGALAFQMVAGVGQILIGVVVLTEGALAAGLFYMVHHMITMGALVLAAGAIEHTYGSGRFDRLSGLMKRDPWLAATVAVGFVSLVGLPPTSGLWGKVGLVLSSASSNEPTRWWLLGAIVLASVVSAMALQRVWREAFWGAPMKDYLPDDPTTSRGTPTPIADDARVEKRFQAPAILLVGVSLGLFLGIGWVWPILETAAANLIDTAQYVKAVMG